MQLVMEHQQEEMLGLRRCSLPVILGVRDICSRIFMIAWLFVVCMVHQTSSLLLHAIPSGLRLQRHLDLRQVKPCDRADMVVRVFHMKLQEYLTDIKEGHIFGPVRAGLFLYNNFYCRLFFRLWVFQLFVYSDSI